MVKYTLKILHDLLQYFLIVYDHFVETRFYKVDVFTGDF